MQTAVIVPTLDEVENIEPLLAQIEQSGLLFSEIIFVDDGSTDGTREKIRALNESRRVRLVAREGGERGLAGAIITGANVAIAETVVVMDADFEHPPELIPDLVAAWRAGAKIVATSRSDDAQVSVMKRLTSRPSESATISAALARPSTSRTGKPYTQRATYRPSS